MALRNPVKYVQYRGHELVTAAASLPVTLTQLKAQLGLDDTDTSQDDFLTLLIEASVNKIEEYTGIALITQTHKMTLDHWPNEELDWWDGVRSGAISNLNTSTEVTLPRYPLQSVSEVTADGVAITVNDTFIVDTSRKPGRIALKDGASYPSVTNSANGITIIYVAGFGSAINVPSSLRMAVLNMSAYMFENRGDCSPSQALMNESVMSLIDGYKVVRI